MDGMDPAVFVRTAAQTVSTTDRRTTRATSCAVEIRGTNHVRAARGDRNKTHRTRQTIIVTEVRVQIQDTIWRRRVRVDRAEDSQIRDA